MLKNKVASDVRVVSLFLINLTAVRLKLKLIMSALWVPNEFVVGFGLDYDQKYRTFTICWCIKRMKFINKKKSK